MIRILHGENDFAISERLSQIKASFTPADTLEFNLTEYSAASFDPAQVFATANTPPFLASYRIVILKDVLGYVDSARNRQGGPGGNLNEKTHAKMLKTQETQAWKGFADMLKNPLPGVELVFVETASLRQNGPATSLVPTAEVEKFPRIVRWREVSHWINERFKYRGGSAEQSAISALYRMCGTDLWLMDNEIIKLILYSEGRTVTQRDVSAMVSDSFPTTIFQAIDAVVEHKPDVALKSFYSLMQDKDALSSILVMLARQTRLLILASFLKGRGVAPNEIGQRLGIRHEFLQRKILTQAARFTMPQLKSIHESVFDVEFAIKTGKIEQQAGLETLVARLAANF